MAKKMSGRDTLASLGLFAGLVIILGIWTNGSESGRLVTAEAYGDRWPFSVEAGRIECDPDLSRTFRANDQIYALNGRAKDRGYQPIDPILLDDQRYSGLAIKIDPQPIIDAAGELCG